MPIHLQNLYLLTWTSLKHGTFHSSQSIAKIKLEFQSEECQRIKEALSIGSKGSFKSLQIDCKSLRHFKNSFNTQVPCCWYDCRTKLSLEWKEHFPNFLFLSKSRTNLLRQTLIGNLFQSKLWSDRIKHYTSKSLLEVLPKQVDHIHLLLKVLAWD